MGLSPVPRLLFEGWSHEDFRSVWDSEDEIEELTKSMVQVAKVRPGAERGWHRLPWAASRLQGSPGLGGLPLGDAQLPAALGGDPSQLSSAGLQ